MANVYQDKKRRNPDGSAKWVMDLRSVRKGREYTEAKTRDEALVLLGARLAPLKSGVDGKPGVMMFDSFVEEEYWAQVAAHKPSTIVRDRSRARQVLPFFGRTPLAKVDRASMKRFVAQQVAAGKAPATINRERMFVSAVLTQAVELEYLEKNPLIGLATLAEDNDATRWLAIEETQRVFDAAKGEKRKVALISLHAGLRLGEILALRRWHVDLEARVLQVITAKGHCSRIVPLDSTLMQLFDAMRDRLPDSRFFSITAGRVSHWFGALLKKLGIVEASFKTLRHTFATRARQAGVDRSDVQDLLGHSTERMTKRYDHAGLSPLRAAIDRMEAVSRGAENVSATLKLPFKDAK